MNWASDAEIGAQRYWVSTPAGSSYSVLEPLTAAERASQRAGSAYWREYGSEFASGVGRFAAAVPLFAEALIDGVKVIEDIANRPPSPDPSQYDMVDFKMGPAHYIGNKRSRSDSTARSKNGFVFGSTGVTDASHGALVPYSRGNISTGKKMSKKQRLAKLIKSETSSWIFRFGGITQYSGGSGYYSMNNIRDGTPGAEFYRVPVHCYDLTSIINHTGDNALHTPFGYELGIFGNTPGVRWDPISGSSNSGGNATVASINTEQGPALVPGATTALGSKGLLDWVDFRFMLYGMSTSQTRYRISIVQFTDETYNPGGVRPQVGNAFIPWNGVVNHETFDVSVQRFWMEHLRPWVYNPIMPSLNKENYIRTLKSYDVSLSPRLTTAGDNNTPTCHELKGFLRMNRLCNYQWEHRNRNVNIQLAQMQDDGINITDDNNESLPYVDPSARIYLMVQSNALYNGAPNVPVMRATDPANAIYNPSYDMLVRTKYSCLDKN